MFVDSPAAGSVISYNDISNNDAGMGVFGNSECCKIDHNTLTNNRFRANILSLIPKYLEEILGY